MAAKIKTYQVEFFDAEKLLIKEYFYSSSNSTVVNGKIDLSAQNPYTLKHPKLVSYNFRHLMPAYSHSCTRVGVTSSILDSIPGPTPATVQQIALAKYNGRLKKGRASLGVTLGSWKQSSSMINTRLGQASRAATKVHKKLVKDKRRLRAIRKQKDPLASLVLETEFGWRPLLQDIHNAIQVIGGSTLPVARIKGTHVETKVTQIRDDFVPGKGSQLMRNHLYFKSYRVTIVSTCKVTNPNLFLLENLGLINPLVVAWDLIPWSFVVGMFVNINALLSQLTATVGMTVTNKSITSTAIVNAVYNETQHQLLIIPPSTTPTDYVIATLSKEFSGKTKGRSVGSIPSVSLSFSVPELNKEQLVIAASLVVQKFTKISKLISI